MTDKARFIEEIIINSLKSFLTGRVNELLGEVEFLIPPIEFFHKTTSNYYSTTPVLWLSTGERTEKERIVRLDVYTLTITLNVPEYPEGERNCYAYAGAVSAALGDDPTLGGIASRAVLMGKKYTPPKHSGTGGDWEVELKIHILVDF